MVERKQSHAFIFAADVSCFSEAPATSSGQSEVDILDG
jgi:hypothetical protein